MTLAEIDKIREILPEKPDQILIDSIYNIVDGELGIGYMVFSTERVNVAPSMQDMMDNRTHGKKVWAAYCTCTCCNESFLTRKTPGIDAVEMYFGDDGCMYTMDLDGGCAAFSDVEPAGLGSIQVMEGDFISCPYCGCDTKILSAKSIRGGRTHGVQVAQLLALSGYAVIVYWMVQRHIEESGIDYVDITPRDAFVLGEKGQIIHFIRKKSNGYQNRFGFWSYSQNTKDSWDKMYHDWGSTYNRKRGSILCNILPSMVGTTGEKTGLYEYWRQKGCRPVEYLKVWKRWPAIENLVNDGLGHLIDELVEKCCDYRYERYWEFSIKLDLTKRKPHEMLRFSKREYRNIDKQHIHDSSMNALIKFRERGFQGSADAILGLYAMDSGSTLSKLQYAMNQNGDITIEPYVRYMEKQGCAINEIQLLLDTRDFSLRLGNGQPLSQEELWPRRLVETHDRLAEMIAVMDQKEKAEQYQKGFDQVLAECGPLEWTDGDLCIRLPRCNGELVQEGKVLRHCVGGYGSSHSQGKELIFFVRRYRRPERSYYTLNISMGLEPKEIQLHGYGNERHGDKKQYSHKIPQKVRTFCNRWEREVLVPYCQERYKENKKEKSA